MIERPITDGFEANLRAEHGPLMSGSELWKTLGFQNSAAFRQANTQGRLKIKVFTIPGRRGAFAFTKDVAKWLTNLEKEVKM